MTNRLICIIGPDGAGKSTQVDLLINKLRRKGIDCEYKWSRFYHFFSLPLLAFARIIGLSEIKIIASGRKIGYHYFYKSRLVSSLYPVFLFIDTLVFTIIKIYIPIKLFRKTIVSDRFIYDTIVDMMVSTGNYKLYTSRIGKFFLCLIPKNNKTILLIADEGILRIRRDDIMYDENLNFKIKLYKKLAQEFNIPTIDASLSIGKINQKIEDLTLK